MITWRRLTEDDFPLLISWLEQPHVARWWNHETSIEAVRRDFGPALAWPTTPSIWRRSPP